MTKNEPRPTCDYSGLPCAHWEPGEPGNCLAMTSEACPPNIPGDVTTIAASQRRQMEPKSKAGAQVAPDPTKGEGKE